MTSLLGHGIWLTLVFGNVGVDKVDDIRTDGSTEDGGDFDRLVGVGALNGEDFDLGSIGKGLGHIRYANGWMDTKDGGQDGYHLI